MRYMTFTMHILATLDLALEGILRVNQEIACNLLGLFARKMDHLSVKELNKEN
jgi:hypothetical protein